VRLAEIVEDNGLEFDCLSIRAQLHFALGEVAAAETDFARATALRKKPLHSRPGFWQADCKLFLGDRTGALSQTQANLEICGRNGWGGEICRCKALLARLLASDDLPQATEQLADARLFAERSGEVELQLLCFRVACELFRQRDDLPQSAAEGEAGILLADGCGFGKYSIDIRISLAEAYLAAGNFQKALQTARAALDLSEKEECQYAWGKADGLHFCGLTHLRLGEMELARERLGAALAVRERLGHGRIEETRRALEEMGGSGRAAGAPV
jgi:tetratricopeptide (TPR) repeat protein